MGILVAAQVFSGISLDDGFLTLAVAGLILALANTYMKPLVVVLSLPAILLSLGLFMLVVNGLMVSLADWVYDGLKISGFWYSVLAGVSITAVNYLATLGFDHGQKGKHFL